jgi:hypothetical protein
MTKTFTPTYVVLTTSESDVYIAPSKAMNLLVQAANNTGSSVNCELWVTNASNTHLFPIFPSQLITAYNGISDNGKHIFPTGYKIRGVAGSNTAIYIEVNVIEGV